MTARTAYGLDVRRASTHGLDTPRGTHWADRAACSRANNPAVDPDWWWPDPWQLGPDGMRAAHICRSHCPVRAQCQPGRHREPAEASCDRGWPPVCDADRRSGDPVAGGGADQRGRLPVLRRGRGDRMLTAAVIVLAALVIALLAGLVVMCLAYAGCVSHLREVEQLARNLTADLEALSIAGPTAEQRAVAALNPDARQQTLSDAWLAYVDSLPTTHDRENPL